MMTIHQRILGLSMTGAVTLACAGVPSSDGGCPPLSLDADASRALLTSWEGTYHMASWCPVGDCPPGEAKEHQLIIDPDTLTLTWTDGVTAVRTVDLNVGCMTGFTATGWDFHAGTSFIGKYEASDGDVTNIQLGCNAVEVDKVCSLAFSWKDPDAHEDYGVKLFTGMIGVNTETRMILDFPPGQADHQGQMDLRSRSVDGDYRDEIWVHN